MTLTSLSPEAARQHMNQGALLIDIRPADEYAREYIGAALNLPLDQLSNHGHTLAAASTVIFHCRSGNRTQLNAHALRACTAGEAYVLQGGLDAWKKAGLPVQADATQPLELQRQVQIVAGSLIVAGVVLGTAVNPWFYWLAGLVGAGLVFAGVSGFCGLARVLMKMPWNKRALKA